VLDYSRSGKPTDNAFALCRRFQQPRPPRMPECILVIEPCRRPVQDRGVAGRIQYCSPAQRDRPCATGQTRVFIGCSMLQPMNRN